MARVSFLFLFGRLTVAKQPSGEYTAYIPKHNILLYLRSELSKPQKAIYFLYRGGERRYWQKERIATHVFA